MSTPKFVQIHALVSYPAALLNRDDSGLAKRMEYGDAVRTRISSQCLKRHWRTAEDHPWALRHIGPEMSVRSREIPERRILPALEQEAVGTAETRRAAAESLAVWLYGKNAVKTPSSRQQILLGEPEIRYLTSKAREAAQAADAKTAAQKMEELLKAERANLGAMLKEQKAAPGVLAGGLEAALFGRMVTSDPEANTDAAVHVAHALTVHGEQSETDYFTVVDDLAEGTGAGGIFDAELASGLYYVYVCVDVGALVANLGGDADLAGKVVEHLVHLVATVSPGAKKGSTAPYAYAEHLLLEAGDRQPRQLSGAFRRAIRPATLERAAEALERHLANFDGMYGAEEQRIVCSVLPERQAVPVRDAAERLGKAVAGKAP